MHHLGIHLGANNLYVVPGDDGYVCIDAGPDYPSAWEELTAKLAALGIRLRDVKAVALTHHHSDHAGLAVRWQGEGVRIYAGRSDAPLLALSVEERRALRERAAAILVEHGTPAELVSGAALPRAGGRPLGERGTWPGPLRSNPAVPDRLLDDGDLIEDGGVRLRVVACPGHTPGALVLVDERRGGAYTGDHLLPRTVATTGIQFNEQGRRPGMTDFVRSLERTRLLAGTPGWAGHGERLEDAGEASAWSLAYLARRTERIRRRLAEGPGNAYDLTTRLLKHLKPEYIWSAMAETIGVLDLLVESSEVVTERVDGRLVYHLAGRG